MIARENYMDCRMEILLLTSPELNTGLALQFVDRLGIVRALSQGI